MLSAILMMKIVFRISCYYIIHKFQSFAKLHQFCNGLSAKIKLSKTQWHKKEKSGGFLGRLLGLLLNTQLPLTENVIKPLAKSVLIPLGLTAAASATDPVIHKKMFGSGATTLIISN